MDPRIGGWAAIALVVLQLAVRVPFAAKAEKRKVASSRRGPLEVALMAGVTLGMIAAPPVALFSSVLAFADYLLHPAAFGAGLTAGLVGLWLCFRSHADLGTNWSTTLELKEEHTLVTHGVYRRVRHPMYTGLLLTALAQALVLPNWLAGPSYLVAFLLLLVLRVGKEEQMMRDQFGQAYDEYAKSTKRLVPGVF